MPSVLSGPEVRDSALTLGTMGPHSMAPSQDPPEGELLLWADWNSCSPFPPWLLWVM